MEQTKAKNPFDNKSWIVFLAAFAALFIALSNRLGGTPVGVQVLFLLSQIAFVLPPGAALLLYLKPRLDGVRFGIASYLLGFCIILAEYFVFFAVGLKDHILICLIVVSALSIFCLVRKRAELRGMEWDNGGAWAFCALCAGLSLLVLFTALSCYNLPGNGSDLAYIYQDQAWNTGNVTSLASGMPVMDIHIDGFSFGYHYFASAFLAVFKNALGMSSYLLNLRMLPVVQAFVYAGGLYLLFTALFQNKWAAAGAAAIGVFSSALLLGHMLWYAYATVTGLGLALAAAFFFFRYLKETNGDKLWNGNFVLFLIFLAAAVGTKAMMAAGALAGAGVVLLVRALRGKNVKNAIFAGLLTVAVFAGVYLGMVYGTHAFNNMQRAFASIMWKDPAVTYYTQAVAALPNMPSGTVKLLVYPVFLLERYPALVASLVILIVFMVKRKGKDKTVEIFLSSAIFACLAASSVLDQPGMSHILFMEGAMPLCVFALLYALLTAFREGWKKAGKIILCCVVGFVLVWTVGTTVRQTYIAATEGEPARFAGPVPVSSISTDEYEGMVWLNANTDQEAVFACDRQYTVPAEDPYYARYYYYTAFSERQCYLEGYNYVSTRTDNFEEIIYGRIEILRGVYNNDPIALEQMKAEGVDYLVASALNHPEFELDTAYGKLVFENDGMRIYELLRRD